MNRFYTALLTIAALAFSLPAEAQLPPVRYQANEIGNPGAKVKIVEYASLTCSACAAFHTTIYPRLKKDYIETGKIRFEFRDYPLDGLAMAGAMLARCATGERSGKLVEVMYQTQSTWIRAPKPIEPLIGYAQLAGLTSADVDACLKNETLQKTIREIQSTATSLYKVSVTPTLFVEDEKIEGVPDYETLAKLIDRKLADQ